MYIYMMLVITKFMHGKLFLFPYVLNDPKIFSEWKKWRRKKRKKEKENWKKKKKKKEGKRGLNNINKNRIITNENTYLPVIPQLLLLLVAFGPLWVTPWICFLLCQRQSASRWLFSWVQLQGVCPWSPHASGLLQWTLHVHVILVEPTEDKLLYADILCKTKGSDSPHNNVWTSKTSYFFQEEVIWWSQAVLFDGDSTVCTCRQTVVAHMESHEGECLSWSSEE